MKSKRGSLSIEASISLIVFMIAFLSVLSLCKFIKTQVILQHAINQVAKEISIYSYITNKLGFVRTGKDNDAKNNSDEFLKEIVNLESVVRGEAVILNSKSSNDVAITSNYPTPEAVFKDPQYIIDAFVTIAKDETENYLVSKLIASPMSKFLVQKYIPNSFYGEKNADEYLKRLGVINGIDGLNFDTSTIFDDGKSINITVIYSMSVDFPLFTEKIMCFRLNASTIGWQSTLINKETDQIEDEDKDKEGRNIWDVDWRTRTDEFIKIIQKERGKTSVKIPIKLDFYEKNADEYTFVHSIDTDKKTYSNEGELNLKSIKNVINKYSEEALESVKKTEKIETENGKIHDNLSYNGNEKISVLIVIRDTAEIDAMKLEQLAEEISKEIGHGNFKIEFHYTDGIVND